MNIEDPFVVAINDSLQKAGIPAVVAWSDQVAGMINLDLTEQIPLEDTVTRNKLENFITNLKQIHNCAVNRQYI